MAKSSPDLNFGPFTVLLGIISGTVIAIAFGLLVVCLVFWILGDEEPRLLAEVDALLLSTAIFIGLSLCAGLSFYGALKRFAWRYIPMTALWLGLLLTGRFYWPS